MERLSCGTALAVAGLLWLGGCSGAGRDAAVPIAAAPSASASASPTPVVASQPNVPGSVPAATAEGRPAAATAPPRAAEPADPAIELRGDILRLIGTASCRDDSQCRALALGSKPCGGPESYVAWSTAATDGRQLEALAARHKDARHARNQRLGLMSDCAVVPEPAVRCVPAAEAGSAGTCQAVSARVGPVPATR